jgi:hypothetical protein
MLPFAWESARSRSPRSHRGAFLMSLRYAKEILRKEQIRRRGYLPPHKHGLLHPLQATFQRKGMLHSYTGYRKTGLSTKAKGRFLLRDLALSVPIFRDPVLVPDHNACYPGIVWHPRAEPVFLPHSSMIPLAARAFLPPSVSSCLDQVSLPILENDC